MKIQIQAEIFRTMTERAVIAAAKKGISSVVESVLIVAFSDKVIAKAYNLAHYAEITTDAVNVIEEGSIVIHRDNLKSLYNMKGIITIETSEKAGIVKSDKKTSRFFIQDKPDVFPDVSIGETKHAFTIKLSELLAVMTKLKPYLSKSDAKPILKGIHVKGTEGFGTFYGCTGFYGIRQTIHGNFDTFSIVIPEVSKELKDISGVKNNKQDCDITVTHSKRFVVYEGADFKFATRLLEGEYINLENPFNSTFESRFNADASEICGLAKEYKDILIHKTATSKTFLPMIFTNVGGVLSTIALSNQIQTMDNLDSADNVSMPEEYIQSFNPEFVETVMKTFGKESVCVNANKSLWRINGNSDCSALLVPMSSDKDVVSKIHDFIQNVA